MSVHLNFIWPIINLKYFTLIHFYFTKFCSKLRLKDQQTGTSLDDRLTQDDLLIHPTVRRIDRKTHIYQDTHIYTHIHMYVSTSLSFFSSDYNEHNPTYTHIQFDRQYSCFTHTHMNTFSIIISLPLSSWYKIWNILFFNILVFVKFFLSTFFVQILLYVVPSISFQTFLYRHLKLS